MRLGFCTSVRLFLSVCMYAIMILYKCALVFLSVCMYAIRILYKCVFVGVYVCD